jgi:RHS repeat-associated protein
MNLSTSFDGVFRLMCASTRHSLPSSCCSECARWCRGRSASRIASDHRGATWVFPEDAVFEQLAHRSDRAVAASCFGRTRPHRRDSHRGRRRFSGQTRDGRYCRARYYHPSLQRFISEDPIEFASGDVNLYAYVSNDPLDFVDPLGLDKQKQCGFAERFWKNFWTINEPLVRRPLLLVGGLVVGGEFTRLTGVPGPLKWTFSGMPRLQGYVPIARTLGIVGAGATTYTFAQSAATVAAAGALRGGLVFTAFEIVVTFGSAVNAAAVQPLLGPYLGITGCEG